jgi:hypothetical protein
MKLILQNDFSYRFSTLAALSSKRKHRSQCKETLTLESVVKGDLMRGFKTSDGCVLFMGRSA